MFIRHKSNRGFSLLELLVTMTIIAVLAIIAIPTYSEYRIKAKISAMIASTGAAKLAIVNDYFNQNNTLTGITYSANSAPFVTTDAAFISSITITNGVILVSGNSSELGGRSINVQFTPTVENNKFTWACAITSAYSTLAPQDCQTGI